MIKYLIRWTCGYHKIACESGSGIRLLNVMLRYKIDYWGLERGEKGEYIFCLMQKDYKKLDSLLDKYQLRVYSVKGRGLPFICKAHKNRLGLLVGPVFFAVIVYLSSLFIWDVEVVSKTDISHNEILANLKSLGCYEGSFVPSMDFEDLCIDYVNKYKNCAWISVNLKGTVAYVEIQDKRIYDEVNQTPRNLVAAFSGIVDDYAVYSGKSHVKSGSVVKKGDLLVSGIVESKQGEVRLCRAEGEVNAIVEKTLRVEVLYNRKRQKYTGEKYEKLNLRFFNFILPLFSDEPEKDASFTKTKESDSLVLFDKIELPLSIEKEVFREYTVEDITYTQGEAKSLAEKQMKEKFEAELPDAELISVSAKENYFEDKYTLECKFKCRLDITEPKDIILD